MLTNIDNELYCYSNEFHSLLPFDRLYCYVYIQNFNVLYVFQSANKLKIIKTLSFSALFVKY